MKIIIVGIAKANMMKPSSSRNFTKMNPRTYQMPNNNLQE
jgi:hypothetical protein